MKKSQINRIKKFKSKEDISEHRKRVIMSIVLAALMFFSIFGMWASSITSEVIKINEYKFKVEQDEKYSKYPIYTTKVNDQKVFFYYNPQYIVEYDFGVNISEIFNEQEYILFSSNPTSNISSLVDNVRYELNQITGKNVIAGFDNEYLGYEGFPIITCDNSSFDMPVVLFIETTNGTNFEKENTCLIINLNKNDGALIRDKILLNSLGIINE
jgi:hypothetical protein